MCQTRAGESGSWFGIAPNEAGWKNCLPRRVSNVVGLFDIPNQGGKTMSEFTYLYRGGRDTPQSPEQRQKQLQKWAAWGSLRPSPHTNESFTLKSDRSFRGGDPLHLDHSKYNDWIFPIRCCC
jgi:hypothetical protein